MIDVLKYILLGLIQGIAEVLPISSSAHLIIAGEILGVGDDSLTFEIFLHLASLIAILFFLRKKLGRLIKGFCLFIFKGNKEYKLEFKYCLLLVTSTLPAVIFTLLFKDQIEKIGTITWVIGLFLIINGIALFFLSKIDGVKKDSDLNYLDALVIGVGQCFGLFPGISRSGSCLYGAFSRRVEKETAADYAFLLFIPAILGATVLKLSSFNLQSLESNILILYGISFLVALVTTYFAFQVLLKFIKKGKISYFSYYCLLVGLAVLIYGLYK